MEGTFQNAFSKGRACSNELLRGTSLPAEGRETGAGQLLLSSRERSRSRAETLEPSHLV